MIAQEAAVPPRHQVRLSDHVVELAEFPDELSVLDAQALDERQRDLLRALIGFDILREKRFQIFIRLWVRGLAREIEVDDDRGRFCLDDEPQGADQIEALGASLATLADASSRSTTTVGTTFCCHSMKVVKRETPRRGWPRLGPHEGQDRGAIPEDRDADDGQEPEDPHSLGLSMTLVLPLGARLGHWMGRVQQRRGRPGISCEPSDF